MKRLFMLFSAVLFLSACSSYNYYAVKSDRANLAQYRTFAWLPDDSRTADYYDNSIAEDKIMAAASDALEARGLKLDHKQPDLLIKYTANVKNETRTYNEPMYFQAPARLTPVYGSYRGRLVYYYTYTRPFPVYVGSEQRKVNIREGNIMIDLIDRKTSKVIWRGWAEGQVNNPEKAVNDIPKAIAGIFGKYPGS